MISLWQICFFNLHFVTLFYTCFCPPIGKGIGTEWIGGKSHHFVWNWEFFENSFRKWQSVIVECLKNNFFIHKRSQKCFTEMSMFDLKLVMLNHICNISTLQQKFVCLASSAQNSENLSLFLVGNEFVNWYLSYEVKIPTFKPHLIS